MCNCMKFTCCFTNHIYVLVFRADLRVDVIYVIMMQKGKEKKRNHSTQAKLEMADITLKKYCNIL